MLHDGSGDFSFSGLKTAVRYLLPKLDGPLEGQLLADVCASFQEAIVDVLVEKTVQAARSRGCPRIAVSGGVSLNSRLRARFETACRAAHLELLLAPPALCTDNAAMIAAVAQHAYRTGHHTSIEEDIDPNLRLVPQPDRPAFLATR